MHLGMWRRLVSVQTSDRIPAVQTNGLEFLVRTKKKEKKMSSEMNGCKEGQLAGIQPRMRLDLPPGGFLRPDGTPAAGSSVGGASSRGSGTASGSAALLSEHR